MLTKESESNHLAQSKVVMNWTVVDSDWNFSNFKVRLLWTLEKGGGCLCYNLIWSDPGFVNSCVLTSFLCIKVSPFFKFLRSFKTLSFVLLKYKHLLFLIFIPTHCLVHSVNVNKQTLRSDGKLDDVLVCAYKEDIKS